MQDGKGEPIGTSHLPNPTQPGHGGYDRILGHVMTLGDNFFSDFRSVVIAFAPAALDEGKVWSERPGFDRTQFVLRECSRADLASDGVAIGHDNLGNHAHVVHNRDNSNMHPELNIRWSFEDTRDTTA